MKKIWRLFVDDVWLAAALPVWAGVCWLLAPLQNGLLALPAGFAVILLASVWRAAHGRR